MLLIACFCPCMLFRPDYRKQEGGYENTGTFWHTDLLVLAWGLGVVFDKIKQLQEHGEPF